MRLMATASVEMHHRKVRSCSFPGECAGREFPNVAMFKNLLLPFALISCNLSLSDLLDTLMFWFASFSSSKQMACEITS